jgi:putative transcriptional regulator
MRKKAKVFGELRQSLNSALAYEMGESVDLRVTEVLSRPKSLKPAEIRDIRRRLHASQSRFAHFLNVSPKAVQSWEQGSRKPRSAALRLLSIAKKNPKVLLLG